MSKDDITRGHELYLRHLLLLGQAAPIALKAVLVREVNKREKTFANLIAEKKDTFNKYYMAEFLQLFKNDGISTNIDLFDTRLLCVVILVLFESSLAGLEIEAITCISDQRSDLDNYAPFASLNYKTFERKWDPLHSALLDLIKDIDDKAGFECKQMIHSFKSEYISVNIELINKMQQTNDVSLHVQMAIQDKVVAKVHGEKEGICDKDQDGLSLQYGHPVFTDRLEDKFVYDDESAVLACRLRDSRDKVTWRKDYKPIEETDNLKFVADKCCHWLAISRAKLSDTGQYSCVCGHSTTTAFLKVLGIEFRCNYV